MLGNPEKQVYFSPEHKTWRDGEVYEATVNRYRQAAEALGATVDVMKIFDDLLDSFRITTKGSDQADTRARYDRKERLVVLPKGILDKRAEYLIKTACVTGGLPTISVPLGF